jgi:hypothetical protein
MRRIIEITASKTGKMGKSSVAFVLPYILSSKSQIYPHYSMERPVRNDSTLSDRTESGVVEAHLQPWLVILRYVLL